MKGKIIIAAGFLLAVIAGFFIFRTIQHDSKSSVKVSSSPNTTAQSAKSTVIKEYTDPAGFKFSYPSSVSISQKNITNTKTYSSLEASSSSTLGSITIEAVASDSLTLDPILKSQTNVTDISLADLKAKQYKEKGKIITLALDKGVLFTITVSSGENVQFWDEVNKKIISTFTFAPPEETQIQSDADTTTTSPSSDSDISLEGEETIE